MNGKQSILLIVAILVIGTVIGYATGYDQGVCYTSGQSDARYGVNNNASKLAKYSCYQKGYEDYIKNK